MKKKLIATAVAGVFVAPAMALAQSAVQIYGTVNLEYVFHKSNTSQSTADNFNSGASNIGFKGEEKLGGGNSVWFQCESDIGFLKGDQGATSAVNNSTVGSWCGRNSAIGLKGAFGNVSFGTWDSVTKKYTGAVRWGGEAGATAVQGLLVSDNSNASYAATFSARAANSINYSSPSFGGMTFDFQTTNTKASAGNTTAGTKGRATTMGLSYKAGNMTAVVAHGRQTDNRANKGTAATGITDTMTLVGARYKLGKLTFGASFYTGEDEQSSTIKNSRDSYNLGASYDLPGPHSVMVGYTSAGDIKQKGSAAGSGTVGAGTGGSIIVVGYANALSKRTNLGLNYIRASNDANVSNYAAAGGTSSGNGGSNSAVSFQLTHKF